MNWLNHHLLKLKVWQDTHGQDLVEYALATGMIAVVAVAAMPVLTATITTIFSKIGAKVTGAMP